MLQAELRDVEDVADGQDHQQAGDLFPQDRGPVEVVRDLPAQRDGERHPRGEDEGRSHQAVQECQGVMEIALAQRGEERGVYHVRLDHDDDRPSPQQVDELDPAGAGRGRRSHGDLIWMCRDQ